ncbi:chromosome loss- protein [Ciborinia camelliae]|nr:chromosome loss- protein [Ciborinia camelliae]
MAELSIPTTSALPHSQLVPSTHSSVHKLLSRLSRPSLLTLALDWLDERNQANTAPYLLEADDSASDYALDLYPPHATLDSLSELYTSFTTQKGSKRDVLDRILEGDWRHGITLYQLAMADMQYLYDHPVSQKWTALKVVRLSSSSPDHEVPEEEKKETGIPRFHPSTFLQNLQREVLPDVKAHYNLDRHATLPLLLLRIYILDSPYNTSLALSSGSTKPSMVFDSSKTFYIAFPDTSPYIYVSLNSAAGTALGGTDTKSLRKLTLDGIPKAFSRPRERYKLEGTGFSTKNLEALCEKRGGGRHNAAGGAWEVYAGENKKDNPLNPILPTPEDDVPTGADLDSAEKERVIPRSMKRPIEEDGPEMVKRRKNIAKARFGNSAKSNDGKGIERLDIRLEDTFPSLASITPEPENESAIERQRQKNKGRRGTVEAALDRLDEEDGDGIAETERDERGRDTWKPDIRITFHGNHIFAGIRELVEAGIVDGEKMPGWMTGEEGVSLGVVRRGRVRGFKGSGV